MDEKTGPEPFILLSRVPVSLADKDGGADPLFLSETSKCAMAREPKTRFVA